MSGQSTQKRALEDGTEYPGDEHNGIHTKRPWRHQTIFHESLSPRSRGFQIKINSLPLPQIAHPPNVRNEPKSEIICFGMLKAVQIRFNYERKTYSSTLDTLSRDDSKFTTLQLGFLEDRCQVLINGVPIATMGAKTHFALKSLSLSAILSYNCIVLQSELRRKLAVAAESSRTHPSKTHCDVALIVFGPRSMKNSLAKELAKFRLFLQHPVPIPEGVAYENPQYLSITAFSFSNGAILPPISTAILRQTPSMTSTSDLDEQPTIATVLDNLPQNNYVGSIDIDTRIKTMLLRHQTEAVNFLMSRESTEKESEILWKLEGSIPEKPIYRHIITGSTSPKPKDVLGGIFGDGMGLGKTLSMLACIVCSLANANGFVNNSIKADSPGTMHPASVSTTLVIVPSVLLLDAWMDEIRQHIVPGTLSVYKYHGPNRKLPSSSPLPYDIVLSTYGTVAADFSRGGGVLAGFHWYRLILDEAHIIRNWSTNQFKAIYDLSASIRWCVTGTPVQNSLKDLASLITFLRLPLLDNPAIFQKHIEGSRDPVNGVEKTNFRNLRYLLESICLRRSTSSILSSLGVSFTEHRPHLSDVERKGYNELSILCDRYIKAIVNGNSSKSGSKSILIAVLRLRMFCNTGLLGPMHIPVDDAEDDDRLMPDELISLLQQCGQAVCTSCKAEVSSSDAHADVGKQEDLAHRRLRCGECAQNAFNTQYNRKASKDFQRPQSLASSDMMQDIQFGQDQESVLTDNTTDQTSYPSKLLSLAEDIKMNYSQDKSIVFSFWKRSLDLVEKLLTEQGIVFSRVDGSIHSSKRSEVLKMFQENHSNRVLLMTIGTGAVGLNNLSVASRVHILEPQWNPSIEDQAIGRVARLGQRKNVTVIRYIVKNTIEESIESRQLQKLRLVLKSGLKSSNQDRSEGQRRVGHLRTLGRIIESTICTPGSIDKVLR